MKWITKGDRAKENERTNERRDGSDQSIDRSMRGTWESKTIAKKR